MNLFYKEKEFKIPNGVLNERDYLTQFPPQIYLNFWEKIIKEDDVVLDIGAYIGLISVYFNFLKAKVHCFEGSPRNIPRLKLMIESIKENIIVHEVALSNVDQKCYTRFNDCIDREHPFQEINYVKYDEYALEKNIPNPKFVKIDIEGMETIALHSMTNLIYNIKPIWQIEYHSDLPYKYENYSGFVEVEKGGFDFREFESIGYTVFNSKYERTKVKNMQNLENYFFIPREILMI